MKNIFKVYRPYLMMILTVILFLFLQAMCELELPTFMSNIINKGIIPGKLKYIYITGGLMLLISLGSVVSSVLANMFASKVAANTAADLRNKLFKKVMSFSSAEYNKFSSASLITRSTNDIQNIQQTTVMMLRLAIFAPIMGIGALIKALQTGRELSWTIGLAVALVLTMMTIIFLLVMSKFKIIQKLIDRLNLITQERLKGLLVIRAFNAESTEENRFYKSNTELTSINIFVNKVMSFMFPTLTLIMNATGILIVWSGASLINHGDLMVGSILAFLQYSITVIISFLMITVMFIMFPRAAISSKRINEVLEISPSILDPDNSLLNESDKPAKSNHIKDADEHLRGIHIKDTDKLAAEISFSNVSFTYPGGADSTLNNITFTAHPGETTAIIGSTGSGKTTLANLVMRFFDATEGSIKIDGVDVRDMPQKSLRDMIGYVPQRALLFSGTIKGNLLIAKPSATKEEIQSAVNTAQADEFIDEMPLGYDTPLSQGGTSVSGGQKQRLSIARALLKKPPIYIFDDCFSALDFATETKLRKMLKEYASSSTIFVIAQRINTIMNAEQIIVLEEGNIVGIGTHKELMADCPVYREIAMSQFSEEELKNRR